MRLDAAVEAAWPADQREVGAVIELDSGGCVRLLGSSTVPPPEAVEISPQNIAAIHPNCDASPCDDEPCVDIGGDRFVIVGGRVPCMPFAAPTDCLARVRVGWSMIGHYDYRETFTGGEAFEESFGYAEGEYEMVLDGGFGLVLGDWSMTNRLMGIRDTTATGSGSVSQWDITQTLDQNSSGSIVGNVSPNSIAGVNIPWRLVSGSDLPRVEFTGVEGLPFLDEQPCNSRVDFTAGLDGADGYVTHTGMLTATRGRSGQFGLGVYPGEGRYRSSAEVQIRVLEMELADGTVLVFDQCDVPQPRIAVACDPQADPQEITYDAQTLPAWAVSMIEIETGLRYLPTNTPSTGSPITVVYEGEGCPEPPADLWPVARECNGTRTVTFDPATRPADGVTFIVGTVRYRPTIVMSEEPPTAGVWSPDPCPPTDACADLILNDPRCSLPQYRDCPQCVGFDVGDPQPEPDFDVQEGGTIPGLGDMVAEAIRTISLNTILPCSACERRKQVLNRFGERAGRSILRILNW